MSKNTAPLTTQRQIFISYSRRDTAVVSQLHADLKRARYNLWMDTAESGIQLGERWRQSLVDNMSASVAVVACVCPDFLCSPYCNAEIEQALQALKESKPIYALWVRPLNTEDNVLLTINDFTIMPPI